MPEGHAIRRLADTFAHLFVGRACRASSPQGRFEDGAARIDGSAMLAAESHGKHLFLGFPGPDASGDRWVHVHLGLYGSWRFAGDATFAAPPSIGAPRVPDPDPGFTVDTDGERWSPPPPRGAVRLRLATAHGVADLTGPTVCALVDAAGKAAVEAGLGPDPLRGGDDAAHADALRFARAVRASRRRVGELVMDQRIAAGVGNIFRAESLFRAGIGPLRQGRAVSERRLTRLWSELRALMGAAVRTGAIVSVDAPDARKAGPDDPEGRRWYVYHRAGRPCLRCGHPIEERMVAGRRLFWCPACQS